MIDNILLAYQLIAILLFVGHLYIYGALILFLKIIIFGMLPPELRTVYMLTLYSTVGILMLAGLPCIVCVVLAILLYETFRTRSKV